MPKIYLDLKTVSAIPNAYRCSADELMAYSGLNVGNFAFRHALNSLIANLYEYTPMAYSQLNESIGKEPIEQVVVSCANWLCASEQYERSNGVRASIIEKLDCPVISFGLGAQASAKESELKLGPNTERLAKVLSEKCVKLSVRDEFTLNVLEKIGVSNAVVTGCPSNFINLDPNLGTKVVNRAQRIIDKNPKWNDLKVQFNEYSGGHEHSAEVQKRIFRLLSISPSFYVIQSPVLLGFLLGESDSISPDYLRLGGEIENLRNLIRGRTLHFSSIDAWMDFSRTCDLATGMRIHGNMVPLQSGVPSLVIGHDSRTSGLASFMGIPALSPSEFIKMSNSFPSMLFNFICEKMSLYDKRRSQIATVMLDFIESNSLSKAQGIVNIANQC